MRLVIADDHGLTRTGIRSALEQTGRCTIVGEADTGTAVMPLVGRTHPDVVLLDSEMPGLDNLTCLERLRARFPEVAVIILGAEPTQSQLQAAFARGARGWIVKSIDPAELGLAIEHTLDAKVLVPYGPLNDDTATAKAAGLSNRELEIVRLLGRGLSNKEIASELWITVQTVKFHLTNVYRKLSLPNRTAAARWAQETGLLISVVEELATKA
jgi:DNA-binding NarL/FixJ family response regulator